MVWLHGNMRWSEEQLETLLRGPIFLSRLNVVKGLFSNVTTGIIIYHSYGWKTSRRWDRAACKRRHRVFSIFSFLLWGLLEISAPSAPGSLLSFIGGFAILCAGVSWKTLDSLIAKRWGRHSWIMNCNLSSRRPTLANWIGQGAVPVMNWFIVILGSIYSRIVHTAYTDNDTTRRLPFYHFLKVILSWIFVSSWYRSSQPVNYTLIPWAWRAILEVILERRRGVFRDAQRGS